MSSGYVGEVRGGDIEEIREEVGEMREEVEVKGNKGR